MSLAAGTRRNKPHGSMIFLSHSRYFFMIPTRRLSPRFFFSPSTRTDRERDQAHKHQKNQNTKTPKHQNTKTPKHQNTKTQRLSTQHQHPTLRTGNPCTELSIHYHILSFRGAICHSFLFDILDLQSFPFSCYRVEDSNVVDRLSLELDKQATPPPVFTVLLFFQFPLSTVSVFSMMAKKFGGRDWRGYTTLGTSTYLYEAFDGAATRPRRHTL